MTDLFGGAPTIKALSVWEPWASLIAAGVKRHETRHWETTYRGPIAIQAARTLDLAGAPDQLCQDVLGPLWPKDRPRGCVVAVAYLSDCIAWTMRQWGETLGLKTWDMGDGSESVEGDVGAEIHTILVDAGLRDPETNEMASLLQASDDDQLTAAEAWSDLLDKDDRTSPEDQPEMCLITAGELAEYMARAQPKSREDAGAVGIVDGLIGRLNTAELDDGTPLYTHPFPNALRVALSDIAAERQRQVDVEGWSEAHDDEHDDYQMALAAGCYAFHAGRVDEDDAGMFVNAAVRHGWPWDRAWWKPKSRRADLVRAGALIVAEIERLDRAALQAEQKGGA